MLPTGGVEPLTGRSYYQIAMASRSLHRSQDMGRLQEPGPQDTAVGWVGRRGRETRRSSSPASTRGCRRSPPRSRIPRGAPRSSAPRPRRRPDGPGARRASRRPDLGAIAAAAGRGARRAARGARPRVAPATAARRMLIDEKIALAEGALAAAAGVTLDVARRARGHGARRERRGHRERVERGSREPSRSRASRSCLRRAGTAELRPRAARSRRESSRSGRRTSPFPPARGRRFPTSSTSR